jgi:hypothetical protein
MLKLIIKDEFDENIKFIALNTILEDYKLVFLINKILPYQLSKSINPNFIKNKNNIDFEFYKYENEEEELFFYLIPNIIKSINTNVNYNVNIFENQIDKKEYFIPELKKIDYLIKISDININIQEFIKKLNQINTTSTAIVDLNKIKQKKHLIF